MKKLFAILLSIVLLMMVAGCAGGDTQSTEKTKLPMQTEGNETNQPETTEPSQRSQGLTVEQLRHS